MTILQDNAVRLMAIRDFKDGEIERAAGSEWMIKGPVTYIPRVEE